MKEARAALAEVDDEDLRQRTDAWLENALAALNHRNAVLHSMPVTFEPFFGTTPTPTVPKEWLSYFPRKSGAPVHTPLTVDGLTRLRRELEKALDGVVGLMRDLAEERWKDRPTAEF